jgi:mannitol-1-/sugar-/sorbitol-6-phosphatase
MQLKCKAIIFDLDGVLVDSVPGILRIWREWALMHGITHPDLDSLAITTRTEEAVRQLAPHLDVLVEVEYLERKEATAIEGLCAIRGAPSLLGQLPPGTWGVFTSVNRETALAKLSAVNLPVPSVLVSGNQVLRGKPAPDGYLLASSKLEVVPHDCLVIEDTPVGIKGAKAAGIPVIALTTTYPVKQLVSAQVILPDLEAIQVSRPSTVSASQPDNHHGCQTLFLDLSPILCV